MTTQNARASRSHHRPGAPTRDFDWSFRGPAPELQRVNRDACGRCGVRADIGCDHQPNTNTMEKAA